MDTDKEIKTEEDNSKHSLWLLILILIVLFIIGLSFYLVPVIDRIFIDDFNLERFIATNIL